MATTQAPSTDQQEPDTQKVEKGTQHPSDSLESAIQNLEAVQKAIGYGVASRDMVIQAWGYTAMSGRASTKLGVQSHFGLLEKTGKGSLKISDLGKRILVPTSPEERQLAIAEAAMQPTLYAKLIEKYKENALPGMLQNLLIREHGVFAGSAANAARAFRETVEFAGLLRNGVLYTKPLADSKEDRGAEGSLVGSGASKVETAQSSTVLPPATAKEGTQRYTIPLDHAGRLADIQVPIPVTKRDLRKIAAWVKYATENFFDESEEIDRPSVSDS
jgi:hypothetical protein